MKESTWTHKKNELLDNFSLYYDYKVEYEGRHTNYRIVRKIADYQKPLRKKDKRVRDSAYESEIVEVIENDPVQTAANVARIIQKHPAIETFNHADSTVYEYTRVRMRLMFGKAIDEGGTVGKIMDKVWCRLDAKTNTYIPLADDDVKAFCDIFSQKREDIQEIELDILNDFHIGLITEKELGQQIREVGLGSYLEARRDFFCQYGYYPIKVPVYGFVDKDYMEFPF